MTEATETVIGSRVAFQGRLLRLRIDQVRLPSGRESEREIVEHPGAVVILPVTVAGQVLLVRQYRTAAGAMLLELPAGTREPGESVLATAGRELAEETGYVAGRLTELITFYSSPGFLTERVTLVHADGCYPGARPLAADAEVPRLESVPLAEVPALLSGPIPRVENASSLIGLLWLPRGDAR